MEIAVDKNGIFFDFVVINRRSDVSRIIGYNPRAQILDEETTLYVLDSDGVRYWVKDKSIVEIQICLNENGKKDYFPAADHLNSVLINSIKVDRKTKFDNTLIEKLGLLRDDDNARFGVVTYYFNNNSLKCSFTLNDESVVKHISVSSIQDS